MLAIAGGYPLASDQSRTAPTDPVALVAPRPTGEAEGGTAPRDATAATAAGGAAAPADGAPGPGQPAAACGPAPAYDPYALLGPRPAFEANVLEAGRTLDATLARLELARCRDEIRGHRGGGTPPPARP